MAYQIRAQKPGAVSTYHAETEEAALVAFHELRSDGFRIEITDKRSGERIDELDLEERLDSRVLNA